MSLTGGIVLFAIAVAMLFIARPSNGISASYLRVWIVGQIYAMTSMVLGVIGITMIISNWPF